MWGRGAILYSHSRFMMIPSLIFIKLLLITSIIHPLTLLYLTPPPLPQRHPIPFRIRGDGESKNTSSKAQTMQKKVEVVLYVLKLRTYKRNPSLRTLGYAN